jgi:hypothetical protein
VAQTDVLGDEVVFLLDFLEVRPDLGRVGVVVGPELRFPGELVVDAGNVTGASFLRRNITYS